MTDVPIALCATTAMASMKGTMTIATSTTSGVLQDAMIMMEKKNSLPRQVVDVPIQDTEGNPVYGEKREAILNWLWERVENYAKTK